MSGVGKLLLIGLGAVVVGAAVAGSEKSSSAKRLPAPEKPKRLPNKVGQYPARRVHEWRKSVVLDDGILVPRLIYAPTDSPTTAPWVVFAWYDEARDAEVVAVRFNQALGSADVEFAVHCASTHDADRMNFRSYAKTLWPDDKWNDRVVHRYKHRTDRGVFLIDVTVNGETIDFYHESQRPAPRRQATASASKHRPVILELEPVPEPEPQPSPDLKPLDGLDAYRQELLEIEAKRKALDQPDVPPAIKQKLEAFLDQCVMDIQTKYMKTPQKDDLMTPRR